VKEAAFFQEREDVSQSDALPLLAIPALRQNILSFARGVVFIAMV